MGKAKLLGRKTTFIPNSKADMRYRRKAFQRGRETAIRGQRKGRAMEGK